MVQVIWKILYKTSSGLDSGTLYQLRNLIKRRRVTVKIRSDPTACEAFFLLVVKAHILSVAMKEFDLASLDHAPSNEQFQETFVKQTSDRKQEIFLKAVHNIVSKYVHVPSHRKSDDQHHDYILSYAKELLSLDLLYLEFTDAIHEADGLRILRCWRYLLLLFKNNNKHKYAIQALTMLSQYHFPFSKRMVNQLIWSRTINVH
jgi:hypothetical protein